VNPRSARDEDALRWELVASKYERGKFMDPLLARQFRRVHLELCRRWAPATEDPRVLKTDVFGEATCPPRAFSWEIGRPENLVSSDISFELTKTAKANAKRLGYTTASYVVGDARTLPYRDNSFDLVVSDSTLDHFEDTDDITLGIRELARVLRPGGVLIITLDNPRNLSEPLFRAWLALGRGPYFIGKTLSPGALHRTMRDAGLEVTDAATILHNPRFFAKAGMRLLRRLRPPAYETVAERLLDWSDALGKVPTGILTGQFIAARGVKVSRASSDGA